ncbi:MAG: sigma factor-like helix-turn-helix DNA-binding protein, partial [Nanoarchaeota archaeon]|nr:sigma factor-like helix-turn-helix DNA-binding protein [Nanoarchaeota archaeon]
ALTPVLGVLTPRQKEVILGRFGLDKSGEAQTLAAVGERLNVTRERVRQIEQAALALIAKELKNSQLCVNIVNTAKKTLKSSGGVMKQELLLEKLSLAAEGINENYLSLFLEASHEFEFYPEDEEYWAFYYLSNTELRAATGFVEAWENFLESQKEKVLAGPYKTHLKDFIKKKRIDPAHAEQFLAVSKKIHANTYGDIGLRAWPEIRPMTTRDRAYLILRKNKEPLHFVTIADAINDAKLSVQKALAPTVHNELIKDDRFVLVGRGMYALRECGYEPGIAKEVIKRVLKANGPMRAEQVVAEVSKQRTFKANTVVINLQNKNHFERLADGRYRVRES